MNSRASQVGFCSMLSRQPDGKFTAASFASLGRAACYRRAARISPSKRKDGPQKRSRYHPARFWLAAREGLESGIPLERPPGSIAVSRIIYIMENKWATYHLT